MVSIRRTLTGWALFRIRGLHFRDQGMACSILTCLTCCNREEVCY